MMASVPQTLWNADENRPATNAEATEWSKGAGGSSIGWGISPPPRPNPSGILPLDLRVLVLPDKAEAVTKGGIFLPETEVDKQKFAQCKATLIAVGINAFSEAKRNPDFTPPEPGARVLIAKYGGIMVKGKDGVEYRLMNDEDVTARLEE